MPPSTSSPPTSLPNVIPDVGGGRINLLDWKAANIRYSWLLVFATTALLAAIAYLIALAIDPGSAIFFIVIAVLIAGVQSAISYWYSDKLALRASGAREASPEEHRYLVNVSEAVAIGAGVPAPKVYVIDSPVPNAFATGRNPERGAVAVTTGLMEMLERQELEGVVAHEMAHIKNYDILFTSLLAAMVGAIIVLRDLIMRSMFFGVGRRRGGMRRMGRGRGGGKSGGQGIAYALLIVLLILAPILALLLRMAVSRRREFLADATAAYITRNPEGLARALEKLRDYKGETLEVSDGVKHMFFINPDLKLNASGLFATHPPLAERIDRLRRV